MSKIKEVEAQYKERSDARKAKIRQEPKKLKRFFKWLWFLISFPFIWLFYNMRDWRSAVCIILSFALWSGTVWIPGLIALIFKNKALWIVAGSIWAWWLSPVGSPFIDIVIVTAIAFKAIHNKIRERKQRKNDKQNTNKEILK